MKRSGAEEASDIPADEDDRRMEEWSELSNLSYPSDPKLTDELPYN